MQMSMKTGTKVLVTILIAAILVGAVSCILQRHQRQAVIRAMEATYERRTETDRHVEEMDQRQREYVQRVRSRDAEAHERAVSIRDEVERHSKSIHSDDIGRAIELELELYERGLGTGLPGVDGE